MHVPDFVCLPWVLGCVGVVDVDHAGLVPGEVHVVHLVRGPEDRPLVTHHLAVDVVHDVIMAGVDILPANLLTPLKQSLNSLVFPSST